LKFSDFAVEGFCLTVLSALCAESLFFRFNGTLVFSGRRGIKSGIDWLVEQMERSKRTEILRERAGVTGQI
jgi:hypothetical protein